MSSIFLGEQEGPKEKVLKRLGMTEGQALERMRQYAGKDVPVETVPLGRQPSVLFGRYLSTDVLMGLREIGAGYGLDVTWKNTQENCEIFVVYR